MLRTIRKIVAERRQMDIEEIEKQLAYLKETFQDL
jgi:ribosomal protein L29